MKSAKFIVLLETSNPSADEAPEVVIWHNGYDEEAWRGLQLTQTRVKKQPLAVNTQNKTQLYRQYFQGTINRPPLGRHTVYFTLKYRKGSEDWIWANDTSNLVDGELLFQESTLPESLDTCFSKFGQSFHVELGQSQVSDTRMWTLSLAVPPAGKASSFRSELLGVPLYVSRWFALIRQWTPWIGPRHGKGVFKTSEDAIACSFLRRDGLHLVLLALSGVEEMLTYFRDDDFGGLTVTARNEKERENSGRIIAAIGYTHETAFAACVYQARQLTRLYTASVASPVHGLTAGDDTEAQWNQEWNDGLGYCTWNALGQDLTEQKIFDALDVLEKSNVEISNLIIDDNWQSLDNKGAYQDDRGWTDFEANPEGFPRGLGKTVTDIRDKHPTIQHVAVWHAILGYWGAVSPTGNIAKRYKTKQIRREDPLGRVAPGQMTVVTAEDAPRLYDDFYYFLLKSRIDSVKTDAQFFLDLIGDPEDRRTLIRAYQDAWTVSSLKYMRNKSISCMSLVPQIIFHSQLPTDRPRVTLRNSDDFAPENPSSHPWHIWTNAYTALLTQHLNATPDWDMFQTVHEYSSFHAAARCISGGPIYITDEPGKHNADLIRRMTAQTNQGKTITLRPSCFARTVSTGVYTDYGEPRLLKVGAYHGHSETGTGIMGVFNVTHTSLSDFVALHEFRGVQESKKYIVRSYSTGEISEPTSLSDDIPLLSLHLEQRGWEILTSHPLETVTGRGHTVDVAPLGLLDKMSGAAALMRHAIDPEKGQRLQIQVTLKALGKLGVYISILPDKSIDEDFMITLSDQMIPRETVGQFGKVLEIDVERAWKEMGLVTAWNNEVMVEVLMNWELLENSSRTL